MHLYLKIIGAIFITPISSFFLSLLDEHKNDNLAVMQILTVTGCFLISLGYLSTATPALRLWRIIIALVSMVIALVGFILSNKIQFPVADETMWLAIGTIMQFIGAMSLSIVFDTALMQEKRIGKLSCQLLRRLIIWSAVIAGVGITIWITADVWEVGFLLILYSFAILGPSVHAKLER